VRPYLKNKLVIMVHVCAPGYSGEGGRRIVVRGQPGKKQETPSEKQIKSKRTGSSARVID
jgi:hypothetical protein